MYVFLPIFPNSPKKKSAPPKKIHLSYRPTHPQSQSPATKLHIPSKLLTMIPW